MRDIVGQSEQFGSVQNFLKSKDVPQSNRAPADQAYIIETALGVFGCEEVAGRGQDTKQVEVPFISLQLHQALFFCDHRRRMGLPMKAAQMQYILGLLDVSMRKFAFDTGVPLKRLTEVVTDGAPMTPSEVFTLADYLYECVEEALLPKAV